LATGINAGLKDYFHRPFDPTINDSAKAWVINLTCTKKKDHGLAAELWTYSKLAKYILKHTPFAGHKSLSKAVKATIWRILSANEIKPHKIQYYLAKITLIVLIKCLDLQSFYLKIFAGIFKTTRCYIGVVLKI
jgi:hypothetical protein